MTWDLAVARPDDQERAHFVMEDLDYYRFVPGTFCDRPHERLPACTALKEVEVDDEADLVTDVYLARRRMRKAGLHVRRLSAYLVTVAVF